MDEGPEGDESDKGILRQELDGLGDGGPQEADLLLNDARVDDEEEDGGHVRGGVGGGIVLDGSVVGEELGGEVVVGDGGVVRGEVVAVEAEGADPDLGDEVDHAEGVEDGAARATAKRGVREDGHRGKVLYGSVDCRHRNDGVRGLLLGAGDHVPRHAHAVLGFEIYEFRHC